MKMEVVLEERELSFDEFQKNPLSSNQTWIDEKPNRFLITSATSGAIQTPASRPSKI
jgi:hypothetical protein